jgi:hypothetical protein
MTAPAEIEALALRVHDFATARKRSGKLDAMEEASLALAERVLLDCIVARRAEAKAEPVAQGSAITELVVASRLVCYEEEDPKTLDKPLEAFAASVRWDDEPSPTPMTDPAEIEALARVVPP